MKQKRSEHMVVLLIFLLLNLMAHYYISVSKPGMMLNWYLTDDAFYYFKTAQNITEGHGISFDGISPTNGFHPLWMLVCIPVFALARFSLYLPLRVLIIVLGILNAFSGFLLYRIMAAHISKSVGWLAGITWMFLSSIHSVTTKLGLEAGINALSVFLLVFQLSQYLSLDENERKVSSLWRIGMAGVLCLLSRLDNVFIVGMAGLWLVFHDNQIRRYAMLDFLLIAVSALVSYFLRIQITDNILNFQPFATALLILSLAAKPLALYCFGVYHPMEGKDIRQVLVKSVLAVAFATMLISLIIFLLFDVLEIFMGYSRSVLIFDFFLSLALLTGVRMLRWRRCQLFGCDEVEVGYKDHWKDWTSRAAAYFLPVFGSLAAYMAFNYFYSGSAMPVSGKIKHWWGTLPNTIYGRPVKHLSGVLSSFLDPSRETGPFWLLTSPIEGATRFLTSMLDLPGSTGSVSAFINAILWIGLAAGLFMLIYRYRKEAGEIFDRIGLPALAVGCLIHILSYRATGYLQAKYWYWIGEMVLVFLFFGILFGIAYSHAQKRVRAKGWGNFTIGIAVIIICLSFGNRLFHDFPIRGGSAELYDIEAETRFIQRYTQPGDVIGMTGGGLLGYFIPDRTFVNLDGLINSPEYFELMKADQTAGYLKEINMKYVYGENATLLDSDPFRWMFADTLTFLTKGPSFWLYRYQ
jgi:hypothetical protein